MSVERKRNRAYLRYIGDGNSDGNSDINLQGDNEERLTTFKYLGATLAENGDLDTEMTHRPYNTTRMENGKIMYRGFCVTEE